MVILRVLLATSCRRASDRRGIRPLLAADEIEAHRLDVLRVTGQVPETTSHFLS
jgi:hypothetical protein